MRDRLLTVAQAAMIAGEQPVTVRMWIRRKHITRAHGGLISSRQLEAWLDRRNEAMAALRRSRS